MRKILHRPAYWLTGITTIFAIYANAPLTPSNTVRSTIGTAILSAYIFILSGISGAACWDAISYKAATQRMLPPRGVLKLVFWILQPAMLWVAVSYLAIWALVTWQVGSFVVPNLLSIYLATLLGITWALFGIAVGWTLPRPLALVVCVVVPFIVTAMPPSFSSNQWRHMFGIPIGCCQLGGELHHSMVFASTFVLAAMIALFISPLCYRFIGRKMAASTVILALILSPIGYYKATTVRSYAAVQQRAESDEICEGSLCFWKESTPQQIAANREALDLVRATVPAEWVQATPQVRGERYVVQGPIMDIPARFGAISDPLAFEPSDDVPFIFRRHMIRLLIRADLNGELAAVISPQSWYEWATSRTGLPPASAEEIVAFVSEKNRELFPENQ